MADKVVDLEYSILLSRSGGACVASIPELCIAEKRATAQEALGAALLAETETRKALRDKGEPLPPAGGRIDPLPGASRSAGRFLTFFKQILLGYAVVAVITAALLALAYPSVRSRIEQQLNSRDLAADTGKILSRLGISVCSGAR